MDASLKTGKLKDFKTIIAKYKTINWATQKAALATVVRVCGSSYRSPGARMLITSDGRWTGSISGGCLEGDALRKARMVMNEQQALTVTYDTREESNQNLGIGLGCNGVIDVLIEPVDPSDKENPIIFLETFIAAAEPFALATIFSGKYIGQKLLMTESGTIQKSFSDPALTGRGSADLTNIFLTRKSESKEYRDEFAEVFLELIQPAVKLIIFGGGVDARPVQQLAQTLGWTVEITDECVAHLAPVFFPGADRISLCQREFIERDFEITPYTACLLMSHNFDYDCDVLKKLIKSDAHYIGIVGPRKRLDKMAADLMKEGIRINDDQYTRIYAPVGLDIGAEAPDEIAVSIIAEVQAVFASRSGGSLKNRSGPIHLRDKITGQVFKQSWFSDAN